MAYWSAFGDGSMRGWLPVIICSPVAVLLTIANFYVRLCHQPTRVFCLLCSFLCKHILPTLVHGFRYTFHPSWATLATANVHRWRMGSHDQSKSLRVSSELTNELVVPSNLGLRTVEGRKVVT